MYISGDCCLTQVFIQFTVPLNALGKITCHRNRWLNNIDDIKLVSDFIERIQSNFLVGVCDERQLPFVIRGGLDYDLVSERMKPFVRDELFCLLRPVLCYC